MVFLKHNLMTFIYYIFVINTKGAQGPETFGSGHAGYKARYSDRDDNVTGFVSDRVNILS